MRIVDAQIHIWSSRPTDWVPLDGNAVARSWGRRYSPDELLDAMRHAGVAAAALIPPRWEGQGDAVVLEAAERHPETFVAVGRLDPFAPVAGGTPDVRAARTMLGSPADYERVLGGVAETAWASLESRGTPLMIYPPHNLGVVDYLVERFPGLRIAVDHLGLPVGTRIADATPRLRELLQLARHPKVSVKATALPAVAQDPYPFTSTHDVLRRIVDAFGPERVFWGSDLSRLECPYEQVVGLALDALGDYTAAAQALVMGGAFEAWLGPRPSSGADS